MYKHFNISGFSDEISQDIDVQFKALNNLGIKYFEPRGINLKNISELTDEETASLLSKMQLYGISVSSIGSPIGKINITDDFLHHFETFKRTVEIAKKLGTKYIRIFSFYIPSGENPLSYKDEVLKRLGQMSDYAKENGVILLHENEKGIFGERPENCKIIFDALYSDSFQGIFDPANFIQAGCDSFYAFQMLRPFISYMHIKDAMPDGSVVPAGLGAGRISDIIDLIKDDSKKMFLSVEPHLGAFQGLDKLEKGENKTLAQGASSEEKFILAVNSLKDVLKKSGEPEQTVRMGIIGFGNMGQAHAKNIASSIVPDMTLAAVCDTDPAKAEKARELYDIPVYTNDDDILNSSIVDAVLIAVPHYSHPPIAIKAFEKGLNVLTEKPAGVYTAQVLEMNEAAVKSGKHFGIMFNQRTNPMYAKVREMVQSGSLGHIKRISWVITDWYRPNAYHKSASWRSKWDTEGGGTLVNQNPHQLDLWQWMFSMPDYIMADCSFGKYRDIDTDDEVTAYFKYNNGTTGTYITSIAEAPGTNRLEIASDMGKIVIENGQMKFDRLKVSEPEFNRTNEEPFGAPEYETIIPDAQGSGPQHVGILNNFAEAVLQDKPLIAPGEEGIFGVTIADAMYLSSWTGEWVDTKNFPHEKYFALLKEKAENSKNK